VTGDDGAKAPAGGPTLEIVAGHPSAEELAALTVTLAAVLGTQGDPATAGPGGRPGRASGWADRSRMMRFPPGPAPDAWRRSARPR
jgi:hypothetical protein